MDDTKIGAAALLQRLMGPKNTQQIEKRRAVSHGRTPVDAHANHTQHNYVKSIPDGGGAVACTPPQTTSVRYFDAPR